MNVILLSQHTFSFSRKLVFQKLLLITYERAQYLTKCGVKLLESTTDNKNFLQSCPLQLHILCSRIKVWFLKIKVHQVAYAQVWCPVVLLKIGIQGIQSLLLSFCSKFLYELSMKLFDSFMREYLVSLFCSPSFLAFLKFRGL